MPSPLHGLNVIDPYPASNQNSEQLPPDFAAQLDLWSTLSFSNIDDTLPVGGFGGPFSLGGQAPGTLDDLVRMGEEELNQAPAYGTVDPFQVNPSASPPPASKKARISKGASSVKQEKEKASTTAMTSAARTTAAALEDSDDEDIMSKDSLTPLNAAEDKRRRNTAASARFRAKKKEREQALEKRAKELEGRLGELERECEALRRENGWLKGLVVGVTQAGGDLNVSAVGGVPTSLPISSVSHTVGSKRKRD
jgi:hypothetical protein